MTSQINPSNIDGTYPVAGQPNNTEGFRTNFTNTKTNFEIAAKEITDIQTRAVLKSALPGTTLDNNMNDSELYAVQLRDVSYTYVPVPATSGAILIDYAAALYQLITPTGNVSISFINWPNKPGTVGSIRIGFNITDPVYTVTLPASVNVGLQGVQGLVTDPITGSSTITFGRIGQFAFEFASNDGGQNIWLFDESRPIDVFTDRVRITSESVANSTTTGALIVSGGVGIAGNLHVGGAIVGDIQITGVSVTGNVVGGNLNTSGQVVATGNITGGNVRSNGILSSVGNITGGNVNTGQLSLTGNVISVLNVTGNVNGGNLRTTGIVSAAGNITGGNITTAGRLSTSGTVINANVTTAGTIRSSGSAAGVGYAAGAGGTVTQLTSKATGVTLNTVSGEITTDDSTLNGDTSVTFVLTNSAIANTDVMIINHVSGGTIGKYTFNAACNNGNAAITIRNVTSGGGSNEGAALVLRYAVIKGAVT
jgi:hypothetical protein